jgi:S-DNA-T family DNA segregation ATPase FtsK/SpoIIIE
MAAPLGVKSGGETVYLDLHEKYHGPHGLVAGTTGSGKSEILQSYILSMATLFHPYEVGFIIIDFKGGGMVNQFRNLPHLNGAITNIDDGEIERSLSSIKAELKKRQRLFAEQDVNHIDDYIKLYKQGVAKTPLPHLILIVDEFAELKSEQPEFMKELISTARIGRSLGVHLILATQKPAGVVNDQIWSNSKFKLCLKVQNKNDSNEVLKSPLAAEIREPGRAYLQVGNNEIFQLFQSAYSGAPIPNTALENRKAFKLSKVNLYGAREVIFEQKKQVDDNSISQLDAIVDYISEYCGKKHIERLPNLCLPALEENIPYGLLRYTNESKDICVPIGVYDDPENQYQGVMDVNFSQGNIFVIGSSQMGKTNMLQTMIRGIAERYTSDEVHLYILDFASMILKNFESLKHVGGVIVSTDEEKLSAFFKMMQQELVRRRDILSNLGLSSYSAYRDSGKTDMPQIIIMIDNVNAFRELYYSMEDKLTKLVREGSTVGICIVITTRQSSGLGYKYLSNFPKRFALYCNDSGEYTSVIEKCRKSLKPIAGRCLLTIEKDIYYGQIYLAYPAEKEIERVKEIHDFINKINNKDNGSCAVRIPVMPSVVNADTIRNILHEDLKPYRIPVGVNYDNLDVDVMNLKQFQMLGIGGDDNNGRESYVKYIIKTLIDNNENAPINIHLIDDNRKALEKFSKTVATYSTDSNKVIDIVQEVYSVVEKRKENFAEDAPMECIIINNAESYDVLSENKDMLELCRKLLTEYAQYKISIILTNVPNINLTFKNSPFLNFLSSASNLILFYQLEQQKLVPLPREATAKYKEKPLMQGDAYFKCGDYLGKYKMPV